MGSLRPSEYRRLRARIASDGAHEPFLELENAENEGVDVYFCDPHGNERALLLNVRPEMLTIRPINVRPDKPDYLLPKYGSLEQISLARPVQREYELPESPDDVVELLGRLPAGFEKQFRFGLGLFWEFRFICETVARVPGISALILHGGTGGHDAKIDPPFFIMGIQRYHELRNKLLSAASKHQRAAREEKDLLAYHQLLHAADKRAFPRKQKRLSEGVISDLANPGGAEAKISRSDRRSVIRLLHENAEQIASEEPQALLGLKADIERVTLGALIASFEDQLNKNLTEGRWQAFFLANPFVLSLALAVPAMLIQGNPYLGGTRFDRRGGKISDFLLATGTTGNLAIVEIKRPSTPLLAKTEYREGLFAPSAELSATLAQVLDQRYQLQKHLPNLKDDSGLHDIHA